MDDNRAKDIPRISQRFVEAALSDVNHRDQPLACIKEENPQDLLIEKLKMHPAGLEPATLLPHFSATSRRLNALPKVLL